MTALFNRQRLWTLGIALLVGIGGILYGYDIGVVSGALSFMRHEIPMTDTQAGIIVGAVLAGGLIGTMIAGPLADAYGRRTIIAISSLIFISGVLLLLTAASFVSLLIARILLGTGVGIVAVAVPLYVTEIVPRDDRGKYVTFFQLFLTFGIVLAYFVDLIFTPSGNWRAMFAVVLAPALILLVGVLKLPESPRWLIAHDKINLARRILSRTRSKEHVESDLLAIHDSLQHASGSFTELFSPKLWLPLFIGIAIAILNQLTGINSFLQYAPDILKSVGLQSKVVSMLASVGIGALNFVCTVIAIFLIDRVGRKPLLTIGVSGVIIAELLLGWVNMVSFLSPEMRGILSMSGLFLFIIFYAVGPGVVVWLAISELLPTRVRGKAISLCLFFNSLAGTLLASLFLDIRDWLGMAGTFWLCAGFTVLYLLVTVFLLPETKAKSLEDIQQYFRQRWQKVENSDYNTEDSVSRV